MFDFHYLPHSQSSTRRQICRIFAGPQVCRSLWKLCTCYITISNMTVIVNTSRSKLYKIQWKVFSSLYGQNLGCDQLLNDIDIATHILKLEPELDRWQRELPPPLCIRSPSTMAFDSQENSTLERLRIILTLRYLNLKVLLLRPFLSKSLELRVSENSRKDILSSADHLTSTSIRTCVGVAEDIITIVSSIIDAGRGHELLGAWWFTLYYSKPDPDSGLMVLPNILQPFPPL